MDVDGDDYAASDRYAAKGLDSDDDVPKKAAPNRNKTVTEQYQKVCSKLQECIYTAMLTLSFHDLPSSPKFNTFCNVPTRILGALNQSIRPCGSSMLKTSEW
jgi:hypothetical protein